MFSAARIYSLDIETDTDGVNGLDPREARITEIAISTADGDAVFNDASEAHLLYNADRHIRRLPPGLIGTWNGTFFDLPYIADRLSMARATQDAARYAAEKVDLYEFGMRLIPQPGLTPKYDFLPGHSTGYGCWWRTDSPDPRGIHQHLDISDAYKRFAAEAGVKHSLKPVCIANGIEMIEVDRTKMHELTVAERSAYGASDTRGTRALTIKLLGAVE